MIISIIKSNGQSDKRANKPLTAPTATFIVSHQPSVEAAGLGGSVR